MTPMQRYPEPYHFLNLGYTYAMHTDTSAASKQYIRALPVIEYNILASLLKQDGLTRTFGLLSGCTDQVPYSYPREITASMIGTSSLNVIDNFIYCFYSSCSHHRPP